MIACQHKNAKNIDINTVLNDFGRLIQSLFKQIIF